MRTAIRIRDRISEGQDLVVVTVVVLQHHVDKDLIALSGNHDRFGMQDLFVLTELLYEFFDAVFVEKSFFFRRVSALICKRDFQARIEKRQFAQPSRETLELKL